MMTLATTSMLRLVRIKQSRNGLLLHKNVPLVSLVKYALMMPVEVAKRLMMMAYTILMGKMEIGNGLKVQLILKQLLSQMTQSYNR